MSKKVCVLGSCGYLGSVLSTKLVQLGYYVRGVDNLTYGKDSIKHLLGNSNFELCIADKKNLIDLKKNISDCDVIVDCSGIVGEEASSIDEKATNLNDYIAVKAIAELCELYDKPLIFCSSASVYGSQPNKIINETSKTEPLGVYARYKLKCEYAIKQLHHSPCILRFGTLFGKSYRNRFDLVINKFIMQALTGKKITIHGGDQMRPFLHVMDAAESIIFAIERELDGIYNVISENMSIKDAGELIAYVLGAQVEIDPNSTDKRNYKVGMGKIYDMGFNTRYGIKFAVNQLSKQFDGQTINPDDAKYSNFETLKGMV